MDTLLNEAVDLEKLIFDAEHLVDRRNPDALPLAEQAMRQALQSGSPKHIAYAQYILAFYHCLVANDYDRSIELCNKVLQGIDENVLNEIGFKIYMTMGNSYQLLGDVFAAQESYMKGLKQLEAKKELRSREKGFLASFYYNVSLLLSGSELDISTEEYLLKAIEIYKETDNGFKLSKSYVAYAGFFEARGEKPKAIEILFKALEIDERMNDPYSIALTKANLGIQYLRSNMYDLAFSYLQQSLDYYTANNMLYETGMVKLTLGETLFATGKHADGIKELQSAEEVFNKLENKRELSNIYQMLANFIAEVGDHRSALEYQRKYTECLKYFFNTEKTNALTRAKKEFETEQKEKESALLKEKNEEINRYVNKLENSNNELKQFAHVASHDLREPLRMVNSYMMLLKRSMNTTLTEQQNEFISFAIDGAKRMDQLIVDLLRLAKVDSNLQVRNVKLNSVVDEIKLNLDTLVKEKNAVIITGNLPEIMADRTQMLQLFQNIIGNGIKYNKSAEPMVRIHCLRRIGEIEITIADNGIGIPEHYRDRVFQIFQRLHTAQEYTGSGIGLAICKKITESLGGKIAVDSNPSGGSIFRIKLPTNVEAGRLK